MCDGQSICRPQAQLTAQHHHSTKRKLDGSRSRVTAACSMVVCKSIPPNGCSSGNTRVIAVRATEQEHGRAAERERHLHAAGELRLQSESVGANGCRCPTSIDG